MNTYVTVQLLFGAAFALEALLLLWRYHTIVSRPIELRALQQRLFALRDQAILLVAEGEIAEDNHDWQMLYHAINHSAKATSVGEMKSGRLLVIKVLKEAEPPPQEERDRFASLPEAIQEMWLRYVVTILSICLDGSWRFRTTLYLATHWAMLKRWLERQRPEEVARYREWKKSEEEFEKHKKNRKTPAAATC